MKDYEIEIGGQKIDKHYGHWHSVYSELNETDPDEGPKGNTFYDRMVGNGMGTESIALPTTVSVGARTLEAAIEPHLRGWTGIVGSSGTPASMKGKFWI